VENKGGNPLPNELVEVLSNITDARLISKIILNMNNNDLTTLMNLLEFADEGTQKLWLETYSNLMKY
jgi:hypothetical protein